MRKLEVAPNVRAVLIERAQKFEQRLFIHLRRAQKERESGEQVQRAQCDFHGAVPVHAASNRILNPPALELAKELGAEFVVARECVRAPQGDEMRQPIQLPHHARIGSIVPNQIDVGVIGKGPVKARKRIEIPINLPSTKTLFSETKQRPGMLFCDPGRLCQKLRGLVRKECSL